MEKKANRTDVQETKVGNLVLSPINRINPDISRWRMALRSAESPTSPMRATLYDIYSETMLDGMVTSVTERIVIKCTVSPIVFTKDGEADTENPISKMVQTPQFLQFIRYIIESKWFGHSLVEFEFDNETISKIGLIPRKHVVPEKGIVTKRVNDQGGTPYREQPYSDWLVEVGGERALGLLNKACPYAIYKRMGLANWGEFIELFGVPIRKFEYDSNNPNARKEVEKQAKKHGSTATIIMPEGTKMDVIKGGDGSGNSTVFVDYKKANDEEILLIFLLQTMTTLDGSSKSQGEVHERGEGDLISAYKLFIELVLNYDFLPLLALHGFDVEGGSFSYDAKKELSKTELITILKALAAFGNIPLDFIEEHFGIKLNPKEEQQLNLSKKKNRYHLCSHQHLMFEGDSVLLNDISKEETALLRRIFNAEGELLFDAKTFGSLSKFLTSGIQQGFKGRTNVDFDSDDHLAKTILELNTIEFSATKDASLVEELNSLLVDSESFNEFEELASPILDNYNENWLKSEFDLAQSTSQNTANYIRNLETVDSFPYWEYSTVGDDRVREAHERLDGQLFPAVEMGIFTPPNGWGCRCDIIPRATTGGKPVLSNEDAVRVVGAEGVKDMAKAGFAVNRSERYQVYAPKQFYKSDFDIKTLSFVDFGLKPYSDIAKKAPKSNIKKRSKKQAEAWFTERVGNFDMDNPNRIRLLNYQDRPQLLSLKTLQSQSPNVLEMLEDTISKPDEVYSFREGRTYTTRYIKYFKPNPMVVEIKSSAGSDSEIISYKLERSPDKNARTGLLTRKK